MVKNPSKEVVLEKLKELKLKSDTFELNHEEDTVCLIVVVWVGHKLSNSYPFHVEIMNEFYQ